MLIVRCFRLLICFLLLFHSIILFSQKPKIIRGRSGSKHIVINGASKKGKLVDYPDLVIKDQKFTDFNGNNKIDAVEPCTITFKIYNKGVGKAENVQIRANDNDSILQNIEFDKNTILGEIKPGEEKSVTLNLLPGLDIINGYFNLRIVVTEEHGFDAQPIDLKIETLQLLEPMVKISDAVFSTEKGGKIQMNAPVHLKVNVQNTGKGDAKNVKASFLFLNPNCILLSDSSFNIGLLKKEENKVLDFEFMPTRRFSLDTIKIKVHFSETYKKFVVDTVLSVSLSQLLIETNKANVSGFTHEQLTIQPQILKPETDENIPDNNCQNQQRVAIIIGNEEYKQKSLSSEYAVNDANVFNKYAVKTLCIPEKNVILLANATADQINQSIGQVLNNITKAGKDAELFFFYSGRGLTNQNTDMSGIISVDYNGADSKGLIYLADIYKRLSGAKPARMIFFLDVFSANTEANSNKTAKGNIPNNPVKPELPENTIVINSCGKSQPALVYKQKQHGLFSYFLLKKLQETNGNLSYDELFQYLKTNIGLTSLKISQKEQTPFIQTGISMGEIWKQWKLK